MFTKKLSLTKYKKLLTASIQNSTTYRLESFNWFIISLLSTISSFVIFTTATKAGAITNYTANQIGLYVFFSLIIERLIGWYYSWDLQRDINKGGLSNKLLKPYNQLFHYGINELGYKITNNLPYILLTFVIFTSYLIYLNPSKYYIIFFFITSILISCLINFYITAIFGLIAFWTERSGAFVDFFQYIAFFAMGRGFPLDVFPPIILKILNFTPFPYIFYYPITGLIRQESLFYFSKLFIAQTFWLLVTYLIVNFMWTKGLKKYESTGI